MLGHSGAPEDVIYNRVRSTSFIAALPQRQQEQVIEQIRQLVAEEEELRGKETLTVPYQTCAFSTTQGLNMPLTLTLSHRERGPIELG
ncbi:Uncharacterised protein [Serratia fonticola]|uniref:Uncharacterized protein n=1 Tax=Serratia fonticola TaxID=47917 RepID=A0A4U9WGM5_SERFO|nr:Uncharacterised protein [Serratia fonticola]